MTLSQPTISFSVTRNNTYSTPDNWPVGVRGQIGSTGCFRTPLPSGPTRFLHPASAPPLSGPVFQHPLSSAPSFAHLLLSTPPSAPGFSTPCSAPSLQHPVHTLTPPSAPSFSIPFTPAAGWQRGGGGGVAQQTTPGSAHTTPILSHMLQHISRSAAPLDPELRHLTPALGRDEFGGGG